MDSKDGSGSRKCRVVGLLLFGGGSLLLAAAAVTVGVMLTASSNNETVSNSTDQLTTQQIQLLENTSTTTAAGISSTATSRGTSTSAAADLVTGNSHESSATSSSEATPGYNHSGVTANYSSDSVTGNYSSDSVTGNYNSDLVTGNYSSESSANNSPVGVEETTQSVSLSESALEQTTPLIETIDCGQPDNVTNGTFQIQKGTELGAMVQYVCDQGYNLQGGSEMRECQANVQWSGTTPTCEILICGNLTNINNSEISYPNGRVYGSLAVYSCSLGYNLVGSNTRRCNANQSWDGISPTCQIIDCGTLGDPANGEVAVIHKEAWYGCKAGYTVLGNNKRVCGENATWSGVEPECGLSLPFLCSFDSYNKCGLEDGDLEGVPWQWDGEDDIEAVMKNNEKATLSTQSFYGHSGEICFAADVYLDGGDVEVAVYTLSDVEDSGSSITPTASKLLEVCSDDFQRRSFSLAMNITSGDKVLMWVSKIYSSNDADTSFILTNLMVSPQQCPGASSNPTSGKLTSPLYPSKYKNSEFKEYTIEVQDGKRVKITFLFFQTQYNANCLFADYIRVFESGVVLLTHCGTVLPDPIYSHGNQVHIEFETTGLIRKKGWELVWEEVDCGDCDCN